MSVICFSGAPGSGKTTLATALAVRTGVRCGSFGDYVRARAQELGLGTERAALQRLGQLLVDQGAREFCSATLDWLGWSPPQGLVLEGLRHTAVYDALRPLVHPNRVYLVFVDIDSELQRERLRARRDEAPEISLADDATEREICALRLRADIVLDGSQPPESAIVTIKSWLGDHS